MVQIYEFVLANWKAAIEILLLTAVIYYLLLLFRGTRGAAILTGFVIFLLVIVGITQFFQLEVINWILSRVLALLAIMALVIFQPELRRALAQLGSQQLFGTPRQRGELIDVLVETAGSLSQKEFGGLIAVEREVGFRGVAESGVAIDAKATTELMTTIFFPNTPLHDGGVIVRGDRIVAAGCVFPLTQREGLSSYIGMRHRAAIGMTEDTDAIVIVVSEETGEISVAQRGHLVQGLDPVGLRAFLATTLMSSTRPAHWFIEWLRKFIGGLMMSRSDVDDQSSEGFEASGDSEPVKPANATELPGSSSAANERPSREARR